MLVEEAAEAAVLLLQYWSLQIPPPKLGVVVVGDEVWDVIRADGDVWGDSESEDGEAAALLVGAGVVILFCPKFLWWGDRGRPDGRRSSVLSLVSSGRNNEVVLVLISRTR